jgi:hypothetical protein
VWQNRPRHVLTKDRALEEREDASLLERRREQAARRWPRGAASCALPRRDQFLAGRSLAQGGRGVRRGRRTGANAGPVPGRPLRSRRRRHRPAASQRDAAPPAAPVRRLLAGGRAVARVAARSFLGRAIADEPQGDALGPRAAGAGDLSADLAGQRVAIASPVVPRQCDGRPVGVRPASGRRSQALRLSRLVAHSQTGAVLASDRTLARHVQRFVRRAALRSDEHLFRGQRIRSARGLEAPSRLQPRQAAGLSATRHRAGGHAGGAAARL